jgi:hypothetical protein
VRQALEQHERWNLIQSAARAISWPSTRRTRSSSNRPASERHRDRRYRMRSSARRSGTAGSECDGGQAFLDSRQVRQTANAARSNAAGKLATINGTRTAGVSRSDEHSTRTRTRCDRRSGLCKRWC